MAKFQRIPLKPGAEPYEAVAYCDNQDWTLLSKQEEKNFLHYIFDSGAGQVHVMWDHAAKKYFFTVIGEDVKEIVDEIYDSGDNKYSALEVCAYEQAIELATELKDPTDIYYACLISNDVPDEKILRCYKKAFSSSNPDIRFYACTSCSYFIGWKKEISPLLAYLRDDEDTSIQDIAASTLKALEKNDWNMGERYFTEI